MGCGGIVHRGFLNLVDVSAILVKIIRANMARFAERYGIVFPIDGLKKMLVLSVSARKIIPEVHGRVVV